jgi:hypothetical protein
MSSIHLGDATIAWPVKGMSLLAASGSWQQVACVGWSRAAPNSRISGFRLAAEVLAQHAADNTADLDVLVFPFLYCWRQHIELVLKELIVGLDRLAGGAGDWPIGHEILPLWDRFVAALEPADVAHDEGIANIAPVIRELHSLDPAGDSFRYHIHRDLSPTLPQLGNISFDTITDVMVRLSNYLEAAMDQISVLLGHTADMRAE